MGKEISEYQKIEQLLTVCEHVGRKVPYCSHLIDKYSDYWTSRFSDMDEDDRKAIHLDIRKDIRLSVTKWLKNATEQEITEIIRTLHPNTRKYLADKRSLPLGFRYLFRQGEPFVRIPDDFVAPNIFLATSRREGSFIPLQNPLFRGLSEFLKRKTTIKGHCLSMEGSCARMGPHKVRRSAGGFHAGRTLDCSYRGQ